MMMMMMIMTIRIMMMKLAEAAFNYTEQAQLEQKK